MKIAFFDCRFGVSSDMLTGALIDAGAAVEQIRKRIPGLSMRVPFSVDTRKAKAGGICATGLQIRFSSELKAGRKDLPEALAEGELHGLLEECDMAPASAARACAAYDLIAAAYHGPRGGKATVCSLPKAFVEICVFTAALEELGIESILYSKIGVGPQADQPSDRNALMPSPLCAELLKGMPVGPGVVGSNSEPVGVAILKALGQEHVDGWPDMTPAATGYGAGPEKQAGTQRVMRVLVGESAPEASESDAVWVIEANIDDMSGEAMGIAQDKLFAAGALDVYLTPVQMKKNRPGILLTALCHAAALVEVESAMLTHTSTFGVRRSQWRRRKLARDIVSVETQWGPVRVKRGFIAGRLIRCAPEFEDCRRIAQENDLPFESVQRRVIALIAGKE